MEFLHKMDPFTMTVQAVKRSVNLSQTRSIMCDAMSAHNKNMSNVQKLSNAMTEAVIALHPLTPWIKFSIEFAISSLARPPAKLIANKQ